MGEGATAPVTGAGFDLLADAEVGGVARVGSIVTGVAGGVDWSPDRIAIKN